jgi:hypothetical protein
VAHHLRCHVATTRDTRHPDDSFELKLSHQYSSSLGADGEGERDAARVRSSFVLLSFFVGTFCFCYNLPLIAVRKYPHAVARTSQS